MANEASGLPLDVDLDPRRVAEQPLHQREVDPKGKVFRRDGQSRWPEQLLSGQVGEQGLIQRGATPSSAATLASTTDGRAASRAAA